MVLNIRRIEKKRRGKKYGCNNNGDQRYLTMKKQSGRKTSQSTTSTTTISLKNSITAFFFFSLFSSYSLVQACPAQCKCTGVGTPPGSNGVRIVCFPGQTGLPSGMDPNTKALDIAGRPPTSSGNGSSSTTTNNIPTLRNGDFASLTALEELTMPFANLASIEDNALSVLKNLQRLSLHNNKLRQLTPATFSGLDKLGYLDLTNNDGCVIQDDVFGQLTSLKSLYLGEMDLGTVKAQWFRSLAKLEILDLHGNGIESLEAGFLQGLTRLKTLELSGNKLQTLSSSFQTTLASIQVLYLGDNPWHCNCGLTWMKQLPAPSFRGEGLIVCLTPQPLAFLDLDLVSARRMICVPPKILHCGGPYDVTEGNGVTVECVVEGDPFPTVQWVLPDGTVADTTAAGPRFTTLRRTVNSTSAVAAADFSAHHGQWSLKANNPHGNVTEHFVVNVFTTTTSTTSTTTTTTTTAATTTGRLSTANIASLAPKNREAESSAKLTTGVWFYVAMAAFGISALALVSLVLVAAFKVRNNRQVWAERRHSGQSLGPETETDVTVIAKSPIGLRSRVI